MQCHQDKTQLEQEDGSYIKIVDTESSYNTDLEIIMNSELNKSYALIETIKQNDDISKTRYTIDINKCRKNILYYGKNDFCVFTVMDKVGPYTGQTGTGLYYVETASYFPLRGNGWYYYPMIEYCLQQNIINEENIIYTIQSSLPIKYNYFNKLIEYCYKYLPEELKKLSINSLIGSFQPNLTRNQKWKSICIQKNSYNAYEHYVKNDGCFIETFDINDETYYHCYNKEAITKLETEAPIYNQIVQMESIELYKLKMLIEKNGGCVLDVNTDSVTCEFDIFPWTINNDSNIIDFHYDDKTYSPKYKIEHKDHRLEIQRMANFKRTETFKLNVDKFNLSNDNHIDTDFKPLVKKILNSNTSYNIDGRAGVGKSYLIKEIKKQLEIRNKKFVCVAPTNKACRVIDGITLHKFISKLKRKKVLCNLNIDYLIIDEISMIKEVFYKFLLMLKKTKLNIKFLLCGDFEQLSPVNDRINCDYANSPALFELSDGNRLQLNKCRRSNNELYNICQNVDNVKTEDLNNEFTNHHLVYTNKKRIEINKIMNDLQDKKNKKLKLRLEKLSYDENSQAVILFPTVPIIARKSIKNMDIFNNQLFTVKKILFDYILIQDENKKEVKIKIDNFQRSFYLAYSLTIHKSQGATYNEPYSIHEWEKLDKRLKYVALSRATNKNLINII